MADFPVKVNSCTRTCWAQRAEDAGLWNWTREFLEQLTATIRAKFDILKLCGWVFGFMN